MKDNWINNDLTNKQGKPLEIVNDFLPGTIQHSRQIQRDRIHELYAMTYNLIDKPKTLLFDMWFLTNDAILYTMDDKGKIILSVGSDFNPMLNNIDDAVAQFSKKIDYIPKYVRARDYTGSFGDISATITKPPVYIMTADYFPEENDISRILSCPKTFSVPLIELCPNVYDPEWSYFGFDTKRPNRIPNPFRKRLGECFHGAGDEFEESMDVLYRFAKIRENKISMLSEEYVSYRLKETGKKGLMRACMLGGFGSNSDVNAHHRYMDLGAWNMRGKYRY